MKDTGRTAGSRPRRIQSFPWSTAGVGGKLDAVYYETPYYGGTKTVGN